MAKQPVNKDIGSVAHHCGGIAPVRVDARSYLYTCCPKCKNNRETGELYQTYLFHFTEFEKGSQVRRPPTALKEPNQRAIEYHNFCASIKPKEPEVIEQPAPLLTPATEPEPKPEPEVIEKVPDYCPNTEPDVIEPTTEQEPKVAGSNWATVSGVVMLVIAVLGGIWTSI